MASNKKQVKNVARKKPITAREAVQAANRQVWQREFNPDYDQVVLRISNVPFAGLINGAPPPRVS